MSKKAVSVTLRPDNVLWLKTRVKTTGGRSLSEALDAIITEARAGTGASTAAIRSVVGNARIPRSEAELAEAGANLRALFLGSLNRKEKPGLRARREKPRRSAAAKRG